MKKHAVMAAVAAVGTLALAGCSDPTAALANPSQDRVNEACIQAAASSRDSYGHPEGLDAYVEGLPDGEKRQLLEAVKVLGNAEPEEGQHVSADIVAAAEGITDVADPAQFTREAASALRSAQLDCSYGYIRFTGDVDDLQ